MLFRIILFLIVNFAALGIGGYFTGSGVSSAWYAELNKAPWTPPGWVFGAAWTLIMICFSFYMVNVLKSEANKNFLITLFVFQWILNITWNPVFFYYQNVLIGLIIISTLTLLVGYLMIRYWNGIQLKNILILPYFVWLLIATSLNAYILIKN